MPISAIRRILPLGTAATLAALVSLGSAAAQDRPDRTPTPAKAMSLMSAVLPSSDLERSTVFYTRGLGMTAARGANAREVVLRLPGGTASIMLLKPEADTAAPFGPSRVILEVPDIKAVAATLQSAGHGLRGPISENPKYGISIAWVDDPDGNALELIQRGK